jgi:hypothetical protein
MAEVGGTSTVCSHAALAFIRAASCWSSLWPINHSANPNINESIVFIECPEGIQISSEDGPIASEVYPNYGRAVDTTPV